MTREEYKEMYNVVGAAMEVYNVLGRGMAEQIYQEALQKEMSLRGMDAEREKVLTLQYKGQTLDKTYKADMVYNGIIIELKSCEELCSDHRAQLFNYMRITQHTRGILFNFGEKNLHTERFLYIPEYDDFILLNQDNYKDFIITS